MTIIRVDLVFLVETKLLSLEFVKLSFERVKGDADGGERSKERGVNEARGK